MADLDLERFLRDDYARVVRGVALAVGGTDRAEDAVQEALARALVQSRKGRHIDHLAGWVATVAINVVRRTGRRAAREGALLALVGPLQNAAVPSDSIGPDVRAALARLPLRQKQAVVLHHVLEFDVRTIAQLLGVRDGTVKSALSRGRAALAESLQDNTDVEEFHG